MPSTPPAIDNDLVPSTPPAIDNDFMPSTAPAIDNDFVPFTPPADANTTAPAIDNGDTSHDSFKSASEEDPSMIGGTIAKLKAQIKLLKKK